MHCLPLILANIKRSLVLTNLNRRTWHWQNFTAQQLLKDVFGCIWFHSGPGMIETIRDITRDPNLFRVGNYLQQNKLTIDTTRDPELIHESRDGD